MHIGSKGMREGSPPTQILDTEQQVCQTSLRAQLLL